MTRPTIIRRSLLAGAQQATGATVVIDTFRAFTTAAYLLERGVRRIILEETLDGARRRASAVPGSILCGEEGGRRPDDFALGNSPAEVITHADLETRTVVMRTSSGTRGVLAALRAGAAPVYAASLVVAGATADAVRRYSAVTIVASGLGGTTVADEDEETANLIEELLTDRTPDPDRRRRILEGAGTRRLTTTPWIDPADLALCLDISRFGFALEATPDDGAVTLTRS